MASRLSLKLPSLKVTQRSTSGKTVKRVIPRGCFGGVACDRVEEDLAAVGGGASSSYIYLDADDDHSEVSLPEPSRHKIAQESSIAGWRNKFRPDLLKAMIESSAMLSSQKCCLCTNEVTYRCVCPAVQLIFSVNNAWQNSRKKDFFSYW